MKTRAEHVAWCKERALEYIEIGDAASAVASMMSDMTKHPETEAMVRNMGAIALNAALALPSAERFIKGFAE